jgi:hypothetical protein
VRLVLATNHLGLGGSESYLLTVAEQLQRLGHEVAVYSPQAGPGAAVAQERGIPLAGYGELPDELDAALVQDAAVSYDLTAHLPSVPQLFVAHSETFDLQAPPQLGDSVRAIVALNDRVAARMRAFATEREILRLRQPIDTERFVPRAPLPPRPRRALMLSNTPLVDRFELIESACAEAGIELLRLGGHDGQSADPRDALHRAEIVIGYGRSILEGMACGRAAYVYDWNGGDGWVSSETYPAIEADGIAGRSGRGTIDESRLARDLAAYSPAMGPVNHDLVIAHHRANLHAQELIDLLRGLGPPKDQDVQLPLREMARLVRLEWRARTEAQSLVHQNNVLRRELVRSEMRVRAEHEAAIAEAEKAAQLARAYESTLSWRLTTPLRALGRLLRRRSAAQGAAVDRAQELPVATMPGVEQGDRLDPEA